MQATSRLRADNAINTIQPQLVNPASGNFRPTSGGNVFSATTFAIPSFAWSDAPASPIVPTGNLSNAVPRDRDGNLRTAPSVVGAYTSSTSTHWIFLPLAQK